MEHSRTLDPDAAARRLIRRAHNRDGLPEITVGISFLIVAALSYAESSGSRVAAAALAILIPAVCLGAAPAVRAVRRRFLIERMGYVQPRPITNRQMVIGLAGNAAILLALIALSNRLPQADRWLPAATGIAGGVLAGVLGRLPRFVFGGMAMAATGLIVAFSSLSLERSFAILFAVPGLLALVSGTIALSRLMQEPVEHDE